MDPADLEVAAAPLGTGAFGEVFKSTWRGAPVVVKRLKARVCSGPSDSGRTGCV